MNFRRLLPEFRCLSRIAWRSHTILIRAVKRNQRLICLHPPEFQHRWMEAVSLWFL